MDARTPAARHLPTGYVGSFTATPTRATTAAGRLVTGCGPSTAPSSCRVATPVFPCSTRNLNTNRPHDSAGLTIRRALGSITATTSAFTGDAGTVCPCFTTGFVSVRSGNAPVKGPGSCTATRPPVSVIATAVDAACASGAAIIATPFAVTHSASPSNSRSVILVATRSNSGTGFASGAASSMATTLGARAPPRRFFAATRSGVGVAADAVGARGSKRPASVTDQGPYAAPSAVAVISGTAHRAVSSATAAYATGVRFSTDGAPALSVPPLTGPARPLAPSFKDSTRLRLPSFVSPWPCVRFPKTGA